LTSSAGPRPADPRARQPGSQANAKNRFRFNFLSLQGGQKEAEALGMGVDAALSPRNPVACSRSRSYFATWSMAPGPDPVPAGPADPPEDPSLAKARVADAFGFHDDGCRPRRKPVCAMRAGLPFQKQMILVVTVLVRPDKASARRSPPAAWSLPPTRTG
jgi:hypothetical protein